MKKLLIILLFSCLVITPSLTDKDVKQPIEKKSQQTAKNTQQNKWHQGKITTYAQKFEGRRCADGSRFNHRREIVACRSGSFGRKIEIKYGNHTAIVTLTDRGRLPLHRSHCYQYDTTQTVAKKLGLYNPKHGRIIQWRYIDSRQK